MWPGVRPTISFASLSDGEDLSLAPDARDCDHRRLIQDDTAPFHVDDGVCRAEVDRHVGRQQTQHSSKHLTANPIEKTSISLSDWPAISNGLRAPSVACRPPASLRRPAKPAGERENDAALTPTPGARS